MALQAFTANEVDRVKRLLAAQVASMQGRKLEEDDWTRVYCRAKQIPEQGWSNLTIDVDHNGLGVEMKLLCRPGVREGNLKSVCGQRLMHPAADALYSYRGREQSRTRRYGRCLPPIRRLDRPTYCEG